MAEEANEDFIASITQDVMRCLSQERFIEKLDDAFCPDSGSAPAEFCGGDYRVSGSILRKSGFDSLELSEILDVLRLQGGCCDCEILYNVAESSRLKAKYWREQSQHNDDGAKHAHGDSR